MKAVGVLMVLMAVRRPGPTQLRRHALMAHSSTASDAAPAKGPVSADDLKADVVVVGAGPAGSSAAYYLATCGLDVILVDKQELGRDKVCGDGLTPSAVRDL